MSSFSYGLKSNLGYDPFSFVLGADKEKSQTKTDIYFNDVNGDGLVDIVKGASVYFNTIKEDNEGNLIPHFTLNSSETPSPIIATGNIDISDTEITPEEQSDAIKYSPMQDVVRVWVAPFSGKVSIFGKAQLLQPIGSYDQDEYEKSDGVRLAIQVKENEKWSRLIAKGDVSIYNTDVSSISVNKGDRIYFRVQSGNQKMSNGNFDKVKWVSSISYNDHNTIKSMTSDGYETNVYKSNEGHIISSKSWNRIANSSKVSVTGSFKKPITSDNVILKVWTANEMYNDKGEKDATYRKQIVYEKEYAWSETYDGELSIEIPETKDKNFLFEIYSSTNIAWDKIKWTPLLNYETKNGNTISLNGNVYKHIYNKHIQRGSPILNPTNNKVKVIPMLSFTNPTGSTEDVTSAVTVSVKGINKLYTKKTFNVYHGMVPNTLDLDSITIENGQPIWVEYFMDNVLSDKIKVIAMAKIKSKLSTETVDANFYALSKDQSFGILYRGCGQFVYNASGDRYMYPINERDLELPKDDKAKLDPITMAFVPMSPSTETPNRWIGQKESIFIENDIMSSSRMGNPDVVLTNPLSDIANAMYEIAGSKYMNGTRGIGIVLSSVNEGSS